MTDITAADVRAALLRLARDGDVCESVAMRALAESTVGNIVMNTAAYVACERAACAAEARAEGER